MSSTSGGAVKFVSVISASPHPLPADEMAIGASPSRARYCEPFRMASGLGWYLFPPFEFDLRMDEDTIFWRTEGKDWAAVDRTVSFRGGSQLFAEAGAPADSVTGPPPFLAVGPEPGILQVWTGLFAKTPSDCVLLVRSPINLKKPFGFEVIEGVIESDWWFGPILSNLRLRQSGRTISLRAHEPLLQTIPIHRDHLTLTHNIASGVDGVRESMSEIVAALTLRERGKPGAYRRESLKKRHRAGSL